MRTAVLIGNGASTAYNAALAVPRLTEDLLARFREVSGGDVERALSAFAEQLSLLPGRQFESLLGPLDAAAGALGTLQELAPMVPDVNDVAPAMRTVSTFLRHIYRVGLATVLEHIATRTVGEVGQFEHVTGALGSALADLSAPGDLTCATLNYDGHTHAALLAIGEHRSPPYEISDLADGRVTADHAITPGRILSANRVREVDDLLDERVQVLHLHGYLGWLRAPDGEVWKFDLDDLRGAQYWQHLRDGTSDWSPVVVLTDRKQRAIATTPFALAYEAFRDRLVRAGRWLVIGYGLGDEPVNRMFRSALAVRSRYGYAAPDVLIVDRDDDATAVRQRAVAALGLESMRTTVSTLGVPATFESREWATFVDK